MAASKLIPHAEKLMDTRFDNDDAHEFSQVPQQLLAVNLNSVIQ